MLPNYIHNLKYCPEMLLDFSSPFASHDSSACVSQIPLLQSSLSTDKICMIFYPEVGSNQKPMWMLPTLRSILSPSVTIDSTPITTNQVFLLPLRSTPSVGHCIPACMLSHFSHAPPFETLWTVAHQAPLSMGFSRQEYWSGLSCPPSGIFQTQGPNLCLLCLYVSAGRFFTTSASWECKTFALALNPAFFFNFFSSIGWFPLVDRQDIMPLILKSSFSVDTRFSSFYLLLWCTLW